MLKSAWKKVRGILPLPIPRQKKAPPKEPQSKCSGCDEWAHVQDNGTTHDEGASHNSDTLVDSPSGTFPSVDSPADKSLPSLPLQCDEGLESSPRQRPPESRRSSAFPVPARTGGNASQSLLRFNFFRSSLASSTNDTSTSRDTESPGTQQTTIPTPPVTQKGRLSRKRLGVILSPEHVANSFAMFADTERAATSADSERSRYKTPPGLELPDTTHKDINSLSTLPCAPTDTIRIHVRDAKSFVPTEIIPTKIGRPSHSSQLKIFSPNLQVEVIGSGGSGNVYKVTRKTEHGEIVRAVKLVDLTEEDDVGLRVYAEEVRILKDLRKQQMYYGWSEDEESDEDDSHRGLKYVIKLSPYDKFVGICGNAHLYIIMEHYPLVLSEFRGFVAEDELALRFIISQVTNGLNYLHSIGIIHMDIKPENIFVTEKGNCVIGDFGGSLYNPSNPSHVHRSASDLSFWTPGYIAPEAIDKSDPKVNHISDFWSLGVTVYDLVVVPPQFDGNLTHLQLGLQPFMMAHKMNMYGCPRHIWFMVMGMCEEMPQNRWDAPTILDYLNKNYPPLPPASPLLKYNFSSSHGHAAPSRGRVTTERCINKFLSDNILGFDIHLTERITGSYII